MNVAQGASRGGEFILCTPEQQGRILKIDMVTSFTEKQNIFYNYILNVLQIHGFLINKTI